MEFVEDDGMANKQEARSISIIKLLIAKEKILLFLLWVMMGRWQRVLRRLF